MTSDHEHALNELIRQLKADYRELANQHQLARRQLAACIKENMEQRDLIADMEREIASQQNCITRLEIDIDGLEFALEKAAEYLRAGVHINLASHQDKQIRR